MNISTLRKFLSLKLILFIAIVAGHSLLAQDYRVLVFSKTAAFRHDSITNGWTMIQQLGVSNGFVVDVTEDANAFTYTNLAKYAAVVWLSTTGDVLDNSQQAEFQQYIRNSGGYVGIHSATDTEYSWPWYGQLVGAYFSNHPAVVTATIKVADTAHASTATLPRRWIRTDEWYNFRTNPRGAVHVLASLDETTYSPGVGAMGFDHPISWCHNFDGGRAWYTELGHTPESYSEPEFRNHVLGGIQWAAGAKSGDAGATIDTNFTKVVIDPSPTNPMSLTVASDGRVFIAERAGRLKIWNPHAGSLLIAGQIPVFTQIEDGLLGLALDPGFDTNNWLYLYYSPAGSTPEQHLSRFTMIGDNLDISSEKILLKVATQREECCHSGGSLAFGPDGCLFISIGDNTNPFESSGFAPIDERPGRSAWDAQKSASNANDLRGKILRIRPEPDGTYTIPSGNLFPPGTPGTRPEIYTMGNRNPFRISVDPKNGWLYWGEVGPDSGATNASRGPVGHDEWNQARSAGNYGWPYFVGNNLPYRDYDFATTISGNFFDPATPSNNSPNNTGITNLPQARPPWIWTIRSTTTPQFPEILSGSGRCAMAGPVYYFDAHSNSSKRLPGYYDNTIFIYDWARNCFWEVKLDSNGDILKINRFLSTISFIRPHEMELGPDGMLYVIEWGTNFNGDNTNAKVVRIEYSGGNPVPSALSIQGSGANVIISFPQGSGTLESADDVKGLWHPVLPPPASPYVVSRALAMKFYRLRWP